MAFKMKSSPTKLFSNLFKGLKAKKTGNIGEEMKSKYSGEAQRADKVARPGESEYQFRVRTRKARSKKADKSEVKIDPASEVKIDPKVGMGGYTYVTKTPEQYKTTPKTKSTKTKKKVVKTKSNDGPRVSKVKKKTKTIKQDIAPTPGTLDPSSVAAAEELTLEDFKRITKGGDKKVVHAEYPGRPIIDPLIKASSKIGKNITSWFDSLNEGEPKPEIRSGLRKKSPYQKGIGSYARKPKGSRGFKMRRNK